MVDSEDELVVPVWDERSGSNTPPHHVSNSSSDSSAISSSSLISPPPQPVSPHFRGSSSVHRAKGKARYEICECSTRKKGKRIDLNSERNIRQCCKDKGVPFYPVDGQLP
ncbi:predicted protein [Arabidopsis lyrata subsp. lyrata]|uniref:Predicted protein n=1 Tax=Arabidopsis lyrata subsp. lyrata TaxID=81972 RepID=D7KU29_ARALL|nr:predicted protein [Arabidopsis lyrata subsp. lyrata]